MITFIDPAELLNEDILQVGIFSRPDPNTPLQQFYRGANVFITGGSGFLGKVLLEKLLRCFPELGQVYLLLRQKKGRSVQERMEDIFNNVLFVKLLRLSPNIRDKIRIVDGDVALPGLGLSPEDTALLAREVNIVFHGAATIRFDERLQLAVAVNVCGTVSVLELAKQMDKLKAMVHVSTAYSNCPQSEIEEKFYDLPMTYDKLITMVETFPENMMEKITPSVLGVWPNTYTFTKAAAEDAVRQLGPGLPIVVFRPSAVVGIRNDPLPGWCEGLIGPFGLMVGAGMGVLKVVQCDAACLLDLVPVDMTVNGMIAAAWDVGTCNRATSAVEIPIYNYTSYSERQLSYGRFVSVSHKVAEEVPFTDAIWSYSFKTVKIFWVYWIYKMIVQNLLGWVIDTGLVLFGKEPKLGKIYQKLDKSSAVLTFAMTHSWEFPNNNVQALWLKISDPQDKKDFVFDMKQIDWDKYFYNFVRGIRVYVMKDPLSTVPQAIKKQKRLRWIHLSVLSTSLLLLLTISWLILSTIFTLIGSSTTGQPVLENVIWDGSIHSSLTVQSRECLRQCTL